MFLKKEKKIQNMGNMSNDKLALSSLGTLAVVGTSRVRQSLVATRSPVRLAVETEQEEAEEEMEWELVVEVIRLVVVEIEPMVVGIEPVVVEIGPVVVGIGPVGVGIEPAVVGSEQVAVGNGLVLVVVERIPVVEVTALSLEMVAVVNASAPEMC